MKKILIASTALVGFAGAASADIALSGSAEMGIKGGDTITVTGGTATSASTNVQFHNDIDITATMTGEADNGLTFGAALNLEDAAIDTNAPQDVAAWVAYGNMRLTIGETDGAFDAAMQEVNLVGGSIDDAETSHLGFNGNAGLDGTFGAHGGQIATFQYSANSFTGYISVELDDTADGDAVAAVNGVSINPATAATTSEATLTAGNVWLVQPTAASAGAEAGQPVWGLGVRYDAELGGVDLGVGLGHQQTADGGSVKGGEDKRAITGISLDTTFANGLSAAINYSKQSRDSWAKDQTHAAIGVGYTMNALSLGANYGVYTNAGGIDKDTASGFGLVANYDLGGGLVAQAGFATSEYKDDSANDTTRADQWSMGLAMSF